MNKNQIRNLTSEIALELFPDEFPEFSLIQDSYLDEFYSSGTINLNTDSKKGQFQWGDDLDNMFKSAELLIKFLNLLAQFLKIKKDRKPDITEIEDIWKKDLIKIGVSKEIASEMSSKYSKEILEIVTSDKSKKK
ncbi:hypothetical protein [Winogradskyella sp. 3972H.M.0a.05]|uniref:hypothetical protein n=1 Tax=Winogradskyella sp. 3972H.M.0a.05 TaxID=2950277 RepID=UPI003390FC6C